MSSMYPHCTDECCNYLCFNWCPEGYMRGCIAKFLVLEIRVNIVFLNFKTCRNIIFNIEKNSISSSYWYCLCHCSQILFIRYYLQHCSSTNNYKIRQGVHKILSFRLISAPLRRFPNEKKKTNNVDWSSGFNHDTAAMSLISIYMSSYKDIKELILIYNEPN